MGAVKARYHQLSVAAPSPGEASATRKADAKEMVDNAATWRPKALPYLENDREGRRQVRAAARGVVSTSYEDRATFSGEVVEDSDLLLTRRGYKRHRKAESDDCDSDQADVEWDRLYTQQGDQWTHASTGKKRVRVVDPTGRARTYRGSETRSGVRDDEELDQVKRAIASACFMRSSPVLKAGRADAV